MIGDCWLAMAMGDGKWNGYEWWFHGQHTDASFNSLSSYLSLACDCLNCCCCCCIVFAMRFALLIRRFRSLYIFVHSSSGISVVCRNLPEWFLYIHSAVKLQIRTEDGRKTTYIFVLACARWPISDVANDLHPSERGAHCTILQQQRTYVYTNCTYVFKSRTPFMSSSFSLHDCTMFITALFHLLVFFFLYLGWFCIALLTLKTKWEICKDADAGSAASAAVCRDLLGQLPQSVGNHNKKLILIKRFSCNCRQFGYVPRRVRETPSIRRWRWRWRRC